MVGTMHDRLNTESVHWDSRDKRDYLLSVQVLDVADTAIRQGRQRSGVTRDTRQRLRRARKVRMVCIDGSSEGLLQARGGCACVAVARDRRRPRWRLVDTVRGFAGLSTLVASLLTGVDDISAYIGKIVKILLLDVIQCLLFVAERRTVNPPACEESQRVSVTESLRDVHTCSTMQSGFHPGLGDLVPCRIRLVR